MNCIGLNVKNSILWNSPHKAVADTSVYRERLEELESTVSNAATQSELRQIRREIDEIESSASRPGEEQDPDSARRIVESSKAVLGKLSRIEQQAGTNSSASLSVQFIETVESAEEVVTQYGSALEKQQFTMLKRELERAVSKEDNKGFKRAVDEIEGLHWRVLFRHDWFWREIFDTLSLGSPMWIRQRRNPLLHREMPLSQQEMARHYRRLCAVFGNFSLRMSRMKSASEHLVLA